MATPFAQTIVRDTFTRANSGTLGANWTALSDATDTQVLGITSNAAAVQVAGGRAASFWNANNFRTNQYAQVIVNTSATGTNTHLGGPIVLASATGYYGFTFNENSTSNVSIFKVVNGTFTAIGPGVTVALASGVLVRLEVTSVGNVHTLNGYVNGNLISTQTDTDASLASGAPGLTGFFTNASQTIAMNSWEGGNLLWTRQGTVVAIGADGGTEEPTVLYEANPQVLSANADGKIWKMWYLDGWTANTTVFYAESADGITWTPYGSNPVISDGANHPAHGFVFHPPGNTYYGYYVTDEGTNTEFNLWQSTNGVTGWTKTNSSVVAVGGVGAWDHTAIFNPVVFGTAGAWNMLYTGRNTAVANGDYQVGLATSPDLVTWTKYVSNPVIPTGGGGGLSPQNGKTIILNGNLYYLWVHLAPGGAGALLPTEIGLYSSPDLHTWTACAKNPTYLRVLLDEGTNLASGQVADPCAVELSGTTYLFYDTITVQTSGHIHINMANSPFTQLQLFGMIFGANIIAGNVGVAGATVSYSGAASGSVTSDAFGNYVIPINTNGSYTITPSKTGATFSPVSQVQSVSSADVIGLNFNGSTGSGFIGGDNRWCSRMLP